MRPNEFLVIVLTLILFFIGVDLGQGIAVRLGV